MADLSTKKDPLHLKEEKPDYVQDTSGTGGADRPSGVGTDLGEGGSEGVRKPTVHLDAEQVKQAEREGKGF
jgi:hypothetical protein